MSYNGSQALGQQKISLHPFLANEAYVTLNERFSQFARQTVTTRVHLLIYPTIFLIPHTSTFSLHIFSTFSTFIPIKILFKFYILSSTLGVRCYEADKQYFPFNVNVMALRVHTHVVLRWGGSNLKHIGVMDPQICYVYRRGGAQQPHTMIFVMFLYLYK